jgi:hypothetical protein
MGDSLAMYVRANTHAEAAELTLNFLKMEEFIQDPDDIDEDLILVYEVPRNEGCIGVLCWDDIDCVGVPKDDLIEQMRC